MSIRLRVGQSRPKYRSLFATLTITVAFLLAACGGGSTAGEVDEITVDWAY
jgi:hypothetical protein